MWKARIGLRLVEPELKHPALIWGSLSRTPSSGTASLGGPGYEEDDGGGMKTVVVVGEEKYRGGDGSLNGEVVIGGV